ncbi:MAG: hypothetical protein AAGH15_22225, partial [Myxococcota bacterium]
AGGVLYEDGGELCRAQVGTRFSLRGLRPFERRLPGPLQVGVASDGLGEVTAELDGEPLPLEAAALGFESAPTEVGARGWHRIRVSVGDDDRTLRFLVRPPAATWTSDIEALASTHCSSLGACHAADRTDLERPDLSTWEGWVENADIIWTRLVETGDMPPAEARNEEWGPEVLTTFLRWLDAGLPEGETPTEGGGATAP